MIYQGRMEDFGASSHNLRNLFTAFHAFVIFMTLLFTPLHLSILLVSRRQALFTTRKILHLMMQAVAQLQQERLTPALIPVIILFTR